MTGDPSEAERQAVERQMAAIEARYGARLDEAGRVVIRERLLEFHRYAEAVRRAPLTPADEPLPGFAPRPAKEAP
jgi:hypothetical protein